MEFDTHHYEQDRNERNQELDAEGCERKEHAGIDGDGGGGGGGGECGGDPIDHIFLLDIDGEELLFSDEDFPSLPDFPCLSSPSAKNPCLSISSSSSSSTWPFINAGGDDMQQQQIVELEPSPEVAIAAPTESDHNQAILESEALDILGGIELLGLSSDPLELDPSFLFPDDDGATPPPHQQQHQDLMADDGGLGGGTAEAPSEDLAKIFLDWLKCNKDSISPEDLRTIKLKRSTIECAARRLGGGKQGRTQLLKLILAWVQNHHLQRKRRRHRHQHQHQNELFSFPHHPNLHHLPLLADAPINPNPGFDYGFNSESNVARCNYWIPHTENPTFPPTMMSPYNYPNRSIVMNRQPFSPSPGVGLQLHAAVDAWASPQFPSTPSPYSSFTGPSSPYPLPIPTPTPTPQYPGSFTNQYHGKQQLYNPDQRLATLASATKEARKKRMARQRRFSSLHHHRNQTQHHHQLLQQNTRPPCEETSRSNWAFLQDPSTMPSPPPSTAQQLNFQRLESSTDRRQSQGWKTEKNLKFLLQKVLKQSDVGSLGRIVLPKKEAEIHLPELDVRDGISIAMEDIGTSRVWNMRYRFWPNNKSRMYLLENTGDFVRSNRLQEGDFIVIYSDTKCGKYMIRGVKVRQTPELKARQAPARKRSGPEKDGASKG